MLSTPTTRSPRCSRRFATCIPRKPAAPVTRMVMACRLLRPEPAGQGQPFVPRCGEPEHRRKFMSLAAVALDDKYVQDKGRVYLTGTQALVRLPLMQRRRDLAAGLNTAGYITGYRGSPLGGLDTAATQARRFLEAHHVRFQPGLNEDLAATAVWGTQQNDLFGDAVYDGVF